MQDENKEIKKDDENIDFSDGVNFREARFTFGVIAAALTLIAALAIYLIKGDVSEHWVELTLGFAALLICERKFKR